MTGVLRISYFQSFNQILHVMHESGANLFRETVVYLPASQLHTMLLAAWTPPRCAHVRTRWLNVTSALRLAPEGKDAVGLAELTARWHRAGRGPMSR